MSTTKIYTIKSISKLHRISENDLSNMLSHLMVVKKFYSETEYESIKILIELYLGKYEVEKKQICMYCCENKPISEFKIDNRTKTNHSKTMCQECFILSEEIN